MNSRLHIRIIASTLNGELSLQCENNILTKSNGLTFAENFLVASRRLLNCQVYFPYDRGSPTWLSFITPEYIFITAVDASNDITCQ